MSGAIMWNQIVVLVFAILTLLSVCLGEIISYERCGLQNGKCEVNEVRINPCAEASEDKPCKLKRGKPAGVEIDFTPQFSANSLYARATWPNGVFELPLPNMETDACKTTTCPVASGSRQTYTYNIKLSKAFPTGVFPVKYILLGENDEDECCVLLKIQLK